MADPLRLDPAGRQLDERPVDVVPAFGQTGPFTISFTAHGVDKDHSC